MISVDPKWLRSMCFACFFFGAMVMGLAIKSIGEPAAMSVSAIGLICAIWLMMFMPSGGDDRE